MAYRRFRLPEIQIGPATLANPATVQTAQLQSVAALASVAGAEPKSALPSGKNVAGLATVAGPNSVFDVRDRVAAADRVRSAGGDWQDVQETVRIVRLACRFGGCRPYFVCPGVVNGIACDRCVAK